MIVVVKDSRPNRGQAHGRIRQICAAARLELEKKYHPGARGGGSGQTRGRARIRVIEVDDEKEVAAAEKNQYGAIKVRALFKKAYETVPDADTYTYVNSDILFDDSFVRTVGAAWDQVPGHNFLLVGRRINVPLPAVPVPGALPTTGVSSTNVKSGDDHRPASEWVALARRSGVMFRPDAQDYFVVSRRALLGWFFPDPVIQHLVIGRVCYDNYLVYSALQKQASSSRGSWLSGGQAAGGSALRVVDVSETVAAVHLMDEMGAYSGGGKGVSAENFDYNYQFMGAELKRKADGTPSHIDGSWVTDAGLVTATTAAGHAGAIEEGASCSWCAAGAAMGQHIVVATRSELWWTRLFERWCCIFG